MKRAILAAALAMVLVPSAAFADSVDFGFTGGTVSITWDTIAGSSTWTVLSNPSSGTIIAAGGTGLGTFTFTTGMWQSCVDVDCNSSVYAPGGSIIFTTGANFNTAVELATGVNPGLAVGTVVFSGSFSDNTTFSCVLTNGSCEPIGGSYHFNLSGPVTGELLQALLDILGISSPNTNADGSLITLILTVPNGGNGGSIGSGNVVVTPVAEPGTLALLGTGFLGILGMVRRRSLA